MAWANDVATAVLAKLTKTSSGPEYDEAVRTGTAYWLLVFEGKDAEAAKQANDAALSKLLGCSAQVNGRQLTLKERFSRALHDPTTTSH